MPFNQLTYREVNKLKIMGKIPSGGVYESYYKDLDVIIGSTTVIFSAYTASGFKFDTFSRTSGSVFGIDSPLITLGFNIAGKAPAFDYPRRFLYAGTDPLSWSIDCYLVLDDPLSSNSSDDPVDVINKNINFPLKRLLGLFLPSRSTDTVTDTIKNITSFIEGDWAAEAVEKTMTKVDKFVGKVWTLQTPYPYNPTVSNESAQLVFKLGSVRIEDVVVKRVSVRVPAYTYENGLPDHLDLNIQFETLRPITTDMFAGNFFNPKMQ